MAHLTRKCFFLSLEAIRLLYVGETVSPSILLHDLKVRLPAAVGDGRRDGGEDGQETLTLTSRAESVSCNTVLTFSSP